MLIASPTNLTYFCIVNGHLTQWTGFGTCNATCGTLGYQNRTRICANWTTGGQPCETLKQGIFLSGGVEIHLQACNGSVCRECFTMY